MELPNNVEEITPHLNTKHGGGPKTPEGKARSSQNATKHGLFTRKLILLPGETQEEFNELQDGYDEDYKPRTTTEQALVYRLATITWRLNRIPNLETLSMLKAEENGDPGGKGTDKWAIYSRRLTSEFKETLNLLHQEQARRIEVMGQEFRQAVLINDYFHRQGIHDWDPASDEFVFSKELIDQQLLFNRQWAKVIKNVYIYPTTKYQDERYLRKAV